MSARHPLAASETVAYEALFGYIEIAHGDPYVPYLSQAEVTHEALSEKISKRILIYERGSQFELLCNVPTTYMWVSKIPHDILEKYNLVVKKCAGNNKRHKDYLIYKSNYRLSEVDNCFIDKVKQTQSELR